MLKAVLLTVPLALVACTTDNQLPPDDAVDNPNNEVDAVEHHDNCLPNRPANSEYAYYNGHVRLWVWPGFYRDDAETFFIWNVGTSIQHGAPYPSASHGKLYAVFTPAPCGAVHHVNGQDMWDHYHVISQGIGVRTFDVELVFPGPSFNAATYSPPLSVDAMNADVASGVLAAPLLTTDAGFDPLVVKVPVI